MKNQLTLTGQTLNISDLMLAIHNNWAIDIDAKALEKVAFCRKVLEDKIAAGDVIYGVNTGFGSNVDVIISPENAIEMQTNLLRSHACGTGEALDNNIVKAMMIIRLNTLLQGHSGVRVVLIETFQKIINKGVLPVIPSQGSVGASGDLCPLSHMGLALLGEGKVTYQAKVYEGEDIKTLYKSLGISPLKLSYKEGLALNNGTTLMAALGAILVHKAEQLCQNSTMVACLAFEAIGARKAAFTPQIHELRRHDGQNHINQYINNIVEDSAMIGSTCQQLLNLIPSEIYDNLAPSVKANLEKVKAGQLLKLSVEDCNQIPAKWQPFVRFAVKKAIPQDAYSIRCTPQVLGASWQAIQHAKNVIEGELNAVVDNPIMLPETGDIISGGNFHGQPIALVLDYLKIAIAEIGNLLERQTNKLCDPHHNDGLPAYLAMDAGLHSGMMIPQYAAAALVSENKVLAHPASVDSIPTCGNQEDHVSMGPIAGRQALEMLHNVEKILAIHLLTAAQAVDLRQNQFAQLGLQMPKMATNTKNCYNNLRQHVSFMAEDRFLHADIQTTLNNLPSIFA